MKHKRLNHHAQNLCQMLCGWELMWDYKRLAELEKGVLIINVLTKACTHNDIPVQSLRIASVLRTWMNQDLKTHNIAFKAIQKAEVRVEFETERHFGQRQPGSWADPTPYFVGCTLHCSSIVSTDERTYTSSYNDEEEWPESYSWN
jgi:hypothetical protein